MKNSRQIGNHARRLLFVLNQMFRDQDIQIVSLSDRETAHRCTFPLKYLAVARMQLVDAKAVMVTERKHGATYEAFQPDVTTQEADV